MGINKVQRFKGSKVQRFKGSKKNSNSLAFYNASCKIIPLIILPHFIIDDPVKSPNLDGFVKCTRSRHANPEE
jgi:hypothetical protein